MKPSVVEEGAQRLSRDLTLVAAVADNGVIGADSDIPWRIPADFAHFKALTLGGVLVMGRATYESIGRPLPGRTTVVLTRDPSWTAGPAHPGVLVATDLDVALDLAAGIGEVFVVGGSAVYAAALDRATHQVLTEVHLSPDGDTRYPDFDRTAWIETKREPHLDGEPGFEFVWLERA
ncbi:dihydrofolate reductase [Marmoricola sp. RAF53]|uniref:dihydrofolate reductase n=1 Tax=Marmoricola sp. RAF53 TaxID=3233059 RepID=UPI003F9B3356